MFCCVSGGDNPCFRCKRHGRGESPNQCQDEFLDGLICQECYMDMEGLEKMVFEHQRGKHELCKGQDDFPESELAFEGKPYHKQRKAEWRHAHGDHSLCKKKYYLGCTEEEREEQASLEKKNKKRIEEEEARMKDEADEKE